MRKSVAMVLVLGVAALVTAQAPPKLTDVEKKAMDRIRQMGGLAMEIAQNDTRLEVSYPQSTDGKFSDENLAPLKDLKNVVHLNLRGQPVTDAQLASLKNLTSLTELHLEKTKITDKGLENLRGLVNLEYLNLYGTDVSDAGLVNLEGMKKLKHLYVWQTKVTAAGADKLKKAIPGVDINRGIEAAPPADKKTEPKKEEKKTEPKKDEKKPAAKKDEKKPEPKKDEKKKDEKKK
jgi:hypothetical protein